MLLDPAGFDLVSGVEELLAEAAEGELADRLKPELMQSALESGTDRLRRHRRGRRPTCA